MTKSNNNQFKIVGIGEVLFDVLPSKQKMLGGATANFAYICGKLGGRGILASRVGEDADGEEILNQLSNKNVEVSFVQTDTEHKTGLVKVELQNGQPDYEIIENVAWDHLEFSESWKNLSENCDAVCFGSLAQRNFVSRNTIQNFLRSTKSNCLKIYDVNLRQDFFTKEIIKTSLESANFLKLNHEELPKIVELFEIKGFNSTDQLKKLQEQFNLNLVCLTRGGNGSLLLNENEISEHVGLNVKIANTIGAGDAFTATLTHGLLHGWNLDEINEKANKVAAFVASNIGAMPDLSNFELD